jgi:DNA-binding LytR/AlgR family response regulator
VPFLISCGQFENTAKAEAFLRENEVDLILLDIEMPKVSGLQWLKTTPVKPMVILTTAFPNYALEGYELDILDYLLKPIAFDRFLKAMHKAREYAELMISATPTAFSSFLFVKCEKRIEKIELNDILYIESLGNYVNIYAGGKKLIAYLTLKGIESQLSANLFIKVHQSFIVAFSKIEAIDGNQVIVTGKPIPISRNYRDNVMKVVEQLLLKR